MFTLVHVDTSLSLKCQPISCLDSSHEPVVSTTYWFRWEITRPSGSFSLVKRRHNLWFGPRSTIWNSCGPGAGSWTCPSATQQGRRSNINHERVFICLFPLVGLNWVPSR